MRCHICVNRVGRVLSEHELLELLAYQLIVPDLEVCRHKEGVTCSRKNYEISDGQCVSSLTENGHTI